mmetsp:Transcript_66622/g.192417  ORF Transcript_66622/g.192417 Transcript_66622/m.192417 type:complete len:219 (-) Transcript_66622:478-1134(-)
MGVVPKHRLLPMRLLEPIDELAAAFLNACIGARLLQVCLDRLGLFGLKWGTTAEVLDVGDEGVADRIFRFDALLLATLQRRRHKIGTGLVHSARDCELLRLDLLMILERELRAIQAEGDDADCPAIHLQPVVHLVEFRRPIVLRAALLGHPLAWCHLPDGTEVAQVQALLRILDVGLVHHVIVALDVPVHATLRVQPSNGGMHLLAEVLYVPNGDHAL